MKIQDIIKVAFYHLNERRRQSFLTASGVAIGCAMLITTISVATGSSTNIREKIVDTSPHVSILPKLSVPRVPENLLTDTTKHGFALVEKNITSSDKQAIKSYAEIVATAEAMKEVEVVSPFVMTKLIVRNKTRFKPSIARGVIPEKEARVISLEKILISGSVEELAYTPNGIMLGDMLAEDLRADYRTRLDLVTEKGEVFPVIVVGRFRSGFSEFDKKMAYINLRLGQRIEGLSQSTVSGIGIRTYNIKDSRDIARRMERLTGYEAESWDETQKNVLEFIQRNNSVTLVLVGFVFVVAGSNVRFNIANSEPIGS
ncbi:MAG: ABC transporter permease [Chlorobiales bacterium]|nr:ABC transporter permease [Chlorobiales bacterium]